MKLKILTFCIVAIAFIGCKNEANDPVLNDNQDGKEVILNVGISSPSSAQSAARRIDGVAITGEDGATIDHYCWQWDGTESLRVVVTDPTNSRAETRIFHMLRHGIIYRDKDGQDCDKEQADKEKSHDGWADFSGTLPSWWNDTDPNMYLEIYTGEENYPIEGYHTATIDGVKKMMSFYAKVPATTDLSKQIMLFPRKAIFLITFDISSCEKVQEPLPSKQYTEQWNHLWYEYRISSVDIIESESGEGSNADNIVKYTYQYPEKAAVAGMVSTTDVSGKTTVVFVLNPNDELKGNLLVHFNFDRTLSKFYIGSSISDLTSTDLFYLDNIDEYVNLGNASGVQFKDDKGNGLGIGLKCTLTATIGGRQS